MINRLVTPFATTLALLAVTAAPRAQEETEKPKTTEAVATAMVLKTADVEIGTSFLEQFDSDSELPNTNEKQHYVLTVTTDGKIQHKLAEGDVGWMHATIYPVALMKLFETEIEDNWEDISGAAIIGLTQMSMTTQDAAKLMKAVKTFPNQIESFAMGISANPQNQLKGLKLSFSLEPTKNTWLGNLAKHLRPHPQGAPKLTAKNAMMRIGVAIDPEGLNTFLTPVVLTLAKFGAKNKKEREKNASLYLKVMNMQDGTYRSVGDPFGGGMRTIGGLRDTTGFAAILHSDQYQRLMKVAESISPNIETEFEAEAFTHRDIKVAKTIMTTDIDTPLAPAGDQINYSAVAGDYLVTTSALSIEDTKKLIDVAADQKIKRSPLAKNALMVMNIKLLDLLDKIVPGNPLSTQEDPAENLRIVFDNKNASLNVLLHFK